MATSFFDTNILVYAMQTTDIRGPRARAVLREGGAISVQVLNEFANVALQKWRKPWPEIEEALQAILVLCGPVLAITLPTHRAAIELSRNHGFSIYDAMIVASALEARCSTLLSEDMQHGRVLEGRLTIVNPFLQQV